MGYNYRLTELQAGLGLSQLNRLKKFIEKRNFIAKRYINNLKNLPLIFQKIDKRTLSSYHLFIILIDRDKVNFDNVYLAKELKKNKIYACLHYLPVHLQPYYQKLGFKKNYLPNTELYGKYALSLPIYPDLSLKDQDYIIKTLKKIFKGNVK